MYNFVQNQRDLSIIMKVKTIKFFSPEENSPKKEKVKSQPKPGGYVSGAGKLVFPSSTLDELGIQAEGSAFKIGTDQGKRSLKSLYLIPAEGDSSAFSLVKSGRGYVIPLAAILKKGGIDFEHNKYTFTASLFNYESNVVGFELYIETEAPKPPYTGKPRGRKPKAAVL